MNRSQGEAAASDSLTDPGTHRWAISGLPDVSSPWQCTLTQKEATMELLRTIVVYAVVAAPALLAAYIVVRWIEAARHSPRTHA